MKKGIIVLLVLCVCSIALADNSQRIVELKQEIAQLQERLQQARQVVNNAEIGIIQRQAIITELESQDAGKAMLEN